MPQMKFPPCGLVYGDLRDQELTRREGNRPFVFFWCVVPPLLALILTPSIVSFLLGLGR